MIFGHACFRGFRVMGVGAGYCLVSAAWRRVDFDFDHDSAGYWFPEVDGDVFVLGSKRNDGELFFEECDDAPYVLAHCGRGRDEIGECVAANVPAVGIGEVLGLGSLDVAVDRFNSVAQSIHFSPLFVP